MKWDALLSTQRTRQLMGGKASRTADIRDEFRRDYGRVVFSTPLRRLQDKAQVFPLEDHDGVRTRLTHTIEVSSIAQDIAQSVSIYLQKEKGLSYDQAKAIETMAATCALLHDMGNPPFGHAGEDSIADWFRLREKEDGPEAFWGGIQDRGNVLPPTIQMKDDFLKFEGNAQTIRIIGKLQLLNDSHGLNLTAGTFAAALKYVASSDQREEGNTARNHFKKHGYFASERDLVKKVREVTGTGTNETPMRHPVAFISEAADDLAYATVDLEDAIRKQVITWSELKKGLLSHALTLSVDADMKTLLEKAETEIDDTVLVLSDAEKAEAYSIMFRTLMIGRGARAAVEVFTGKYDEIMDGTFGSSLLEASETGKLIKSCKKFAASEIYPETGRLELLGRSVIHDLMDFFWVELKSCPAKISEVDSRTFKRKALNLLSSNYRRVFENERAQGTSTLPPRYLEFQLITDYICGMTDTFACSLHRKLFNG